jgi:hypothetical protein
VFTLGGDIDHAVLKSEFRYRIACEQTLVLMDRISDLSGAGLSRRLALRELLNPPEERSIDI